MIKILFLLLITVIILTLQQMNKCDSNISIFLKQINQKITLNITATSNRIVTMHYCDIYIYAAVTVKTIGCKRAPSWCPEWWRAGWGRTRDQEMSSTASTQSAAERAPAHTSTSLHTAWAMSLCHPYGAGIECTCNNRGSPVHCLPIPEHVSQHNHSIKIAQNVT